ncbi:MAG: T9SS type A sorting domain-containing protein [Candidatus Zixiibacteriota bacterium]|nr:MAG: T9SS type A sorting domain-containing protein [candidate division Zixibacteria bacterium]
MKKTLIVTFIAVMIASTLFAEDSSTVHFDVGHLREGPGGCEFGYNDLGKVSVGLRAELPTALYFISLQESESLSDITCEVISRQLIATVDVEETLGDIPTSSSPETYSGAVELRNQHALGQEPVYPVEIVNHGNRKWAKIMVFPVTIDAGGECYFNESIGVRVKNRRVAASALLTSIDLGDPEGALAGIVMSASAGTTSYLIVTSSPLYQSVVELANYRISLGINTTVELIDDILAAYDGRDDAEKLRERLIDFYSGGGQYVLLAGDETQLPIRYAYPYSTTSTPAPNYLQICDLYFADVSGDWDSDNDGIWGENYVDEVDLTPELMVGRLPFNLPGEVDNYVDKLIDYETNPGNGDVDYLERAFFFSSDQMRDDHFGAQHAVIGGAYPGYFEIDTANGVELARGDDPAPYNLPASELISIISSGYGVVNVIAHGNHQLFEVRTSGYNEWPKSRFLTIEGSASDGTVHRLEPNGRVSFYYSLACDNGAFDKDQPPFNFPQPNMVQSLLGLGDAGAVGFVANSRWGWVSSSYLIQTAFFDSLFAHPGRPAVCAMYDAKAAYPFYRDQVLGIDYFGDPVLNVYTAKPGQLSMNIEESDLNLTVKVTSNSSPVSDCAVIVSRSDSILQSSLTAANGTVILTCDLETDTEYTIAAVKDSFAVGRTVYVPTVITDVDDDSDLLPTRFNLCQNYPNPFNPSTTIRFELARKSAVRLAVHNILGQVVTVLKDEAMPAGVHHAIWNGTDQGGNEVGSGIYLYRLETSDFIEGKKMLLLR